MAGGQVAYLNPPIWTDDELLRELRAALDVPVVDEGFIRAARAAFTRRRAGAGLEPPQAARRSLEKYVN